MNTTLKLLFITIIFFAGCTAKNKRNEDSEAADKKDSIAEQEFTFTAFGTSLNHSENWTPEVLEVGNDQNVINIYPAGLNDSLELPLTIHENANLSFISIFPGGYGTELPSGKSRNLKNNNTEPVPFDINPKESLAFLMENGQVWAYFIVPSSPPAGWSQHGFIFTQAAVSNFEIKCFDKESGKELEMSECNPLLGDTVKRYGNVDQNDWQAINKILKSIKFEDSQSMDSSQRGDTTNTIIVTKPQAGSVVSSPLEIKGQAKGNWFFEAVIQIELRKDGNVLASTAGKARGNWMTTDFVDFSATLNFPDVMETGKAELIFRSSNPSGKSSMAKSFRIPVELGE